MRNIYVRETARGGLMKPLRGVCVNNTAGGDERYRRNLGAQDSARRFDEAPTVCVREQHPLDGVSAMCAT